MKLLFKYILLILLAGFIFLLFFPKEYVYYYFINKVEKKKILISHENIENKFMGVDLDNIKARYNNIDVFKSDHVDISTYIFKSIITINNTRLDSILSKYIPSVISEIKIIHNISELNKLYISSSFDGGTLSGFINLKKERIYLKLKLSKEFQEKYTLVMLNLRKEENGQYFIYESHPNKTLIKRSTKINLPVNKNIPLKEDVIIKNNHNNSNNYNIANDISLKAIYTNGKDGWIVISKYGSSDTSPLNIGYTFNKYKLKSIFNEFVVFTRNNKDYKLFLQTNEIKIESIKEKNIINNNLDKKSNEIKYDKFIELNIDNSSDIIKVNKVLIDNYKKDFTKIWDEIRIKEIKKSNKIDGFKINSVLNNSVFTKLGLKKGDIIKSVNGIQITNYIDAFKVYNSINKIKDINIGIIRNDKNMELKYEIK